jgi:hypothetical protein
MEGKKMKRVLALAFAGLLLLSIFAMLPSVSAATSTAAKPALPKTCKEGTVVKQTKGGSMTITTRSNCSRVADIQAGNLSWVLNNLIPSNKRGLLSGSISAISSFASKVAKYATKFALPGSDVTKGFVGRAEMSPDGYTHMEGRVFGLRFTAQLTPKSKTSKSHGMARIDSCPEILQRIGLCETRW